jgi:hypothetical protein
MVSGTQAGIVPIDITSLGIGGANGGASAYSTKTVNFPTSGSSYSLGLYNFPGYSIGLFSNTASFGFAVTGTGSTQRPNKFGYNQLIDSNLTYVQGITTTFLDLMDVSPDFGTGSYMGFKFGSNYGYLEVTWSGATKTFYILSGAYEDSGQAIYTPSGLGGGSGGTVPEPTSMAIFGLGALGFAYRSRRKLMK